MRARILGIELRRSDAPWAALLIAGVGVFVLFASNPPYGSWMELVTTQRDVMQLTWPLALAAGAWQGIRERRSRIEELLATTSRLRRSRVLPIATAMAIAAVVAYVVMLAGAAAHLRHVDSYFPYGAVPLIALGALAMVAGVLLGLAIGSLLPSPLTAPMLVVIGFLGLALLPSVLAPQGQGVDEQGRPGTFLLFPFLQGPRDFGFAVQTLSARANVAQAFWLAALATTGLAVFAAARPRTRVLAAMPALIGLAIALPTMPSALADAWIEDGRATEVVCTGDEPRVCTARAAAHLLDQLSVPAREALSIIAARLPPAPTRVLVQDSGDRPLDGPPPVDTLVVRIPLYDDVSGDSDDNAVLTRDSDDDGVAAMLDGAGVPPCEIREPAKGSAEEAEARYFAARLVATAWLLDGDLTPREGGDEGPAVELASQALADLRTLSADEQQSRVAAWREAERACAEGDRLELLTGVMGPP